MPVGVDVRSDEDVPYSSESPEGGDAGVTVADIHALCRILADLLDVIGVFFGAADSFSLSKVELLATIRCENSEGRRICGAADGIGGFDHVLRGDGPRALGRASRTLYQGYIRVFARHICESSFMCMMEDTINIQKYTSTAADVSKKSRTVSFCLQFTAPIHANARSALVDVQEEGRRERATFRQSTRLFAKDVM